MLDKHAYPNPADHTHLVAILLMVLRDKGTRVYYLCDLEWFVRLKFMQAPWRLESLLGYLSKSASCLL